jgi:PAS domain S-box-containing protein
MMRTEMLVTAAEGRLRRVPRMLELDPFPVIAQATPDFIATIDIQGHILYLNPAGRRMLAIGDHDELSALHISDVHPTWANVIVLGEGIETAVLDGIWQGETALLTHDGREIPVSQTIIAHPDADGNCEFLSMVARDISELAATENALRRSEQFYRRIVETAGVGIWVIDPENRVAFANPALAKALGYTVEDLAGRSLSDVMEIGDRAAPSTGVEAVSDLKNRQTFKLRRKDGSEFWAGMTTSPLYDRDERYDGVLGIVTETNGPRLN